jgi:uncharacterized membrane protein YjgN (DUF898 family)
MGVGTEDQTAFAFEGDWREFVPIAVTNMLLNVATLGFYRFWAKTRERHYLWSKTRFIDDHFEWTGTGKELLFGFLIAVVLFGAPFFLLNLVLQGLVLQGQQQIAGILIGLLYIMLLYLAGVATFRAHRYRLSRTYWHGIHGGTDSQGFDYGWSWLWKSAVAYVCLALLFPWSMTSLWKERWEHMSFGPHRFKSEPQWSSLMGRYIIAYLSPWILLIGAFVLIFSVGIVAGVTSGSGGSPPVALIGLGIGAVIAVYLLIPLAALIYYAAYMREVVGTLQISTLEFDFTARTKDWIKLFLGNFALWLIAGAVAAIPIAAFGLFNQFVEVAPGENAMMNNPIAFIAFAVVVAIAFGMVAPFIRFRTWAFTVRHLEAGGEVNLALLTQSETRELKQGEGLLDAFDMGAM